jgi:MarR family transcriptional regulator, organic hydroperoxide resistance regulator
MFNRALPRDLGRILDFMGVLWSVNHGLESRSKRMAAVHGVTGPQRLVVRIVGRRPGIAAGELAEVLRVHPSTLTGIVRRLVERRLIERRGDPGDRRRALFTLTDRGRRIDELRAGTVEGAISKALHRFGAEDIRRAKELLAAIAETLSED